MKKQLTTIIFLLSALFLSGCGNAEKNKTETANDDMIDIYTTVYPLQYLAEEIGGKYVDVETVYPPGTDEHTYEPSQKDIVNMTNADLFFYIGHNLEGFVTKAQPILSDEGVKTVAIGEKVNLDDEAHTDNEHAHEEETHEEEEHSDDDGHDHGGVDPHLWLNPLYTAQMAEAIKTELTKQMPEQADYFEAQYKQLDEQLHELDTQLADTIKNGKTNEIIVSHAAYGYWEERYGLKQISVTGLTTSTEPSQKELETIVKTAQEHNLKYVVFEQNISSKLTEIIQKEIGAEALQLHNLAILTDDDLQANADYMSLMNKNIKTLQKALN
ncbi:metal ABC transporter solute-binding protein, Zn/Mn family [Peribacillus asahii]|uniref:metal ABC transporter solute-binding protein, Zn/Mn family n=1 Tax=Peribacillus asahii TaxID=228899 RepID=UPI00207ACCB5|nr:zinc ABC transporter substrate-binding protein [Peribacillus asahii]USK69597.1 zinc ABC transporter substrate-binding protein [Peribacillus asahii]